MWRTGTFGAHLKGKTWREARSPAAARDGPAECCIERWIQDGFVERFMGMESAAADYRLQLIPANLEIQDQVEPCNVERDSVREL